GKRMPRIPLEFTGRPNMRVKKRFQTMCKLILFFGQDGFIQDLGLIFLKPFKNWVGKEVNYQWFVIRSEPLPTPMYYAVPLLKLSKQSPMPMVVTILQMKGWPPGMILPMK